MEFENDKAIEQIIEGTCEKVSASTVHYLSRSLDNIEFNVNSKQLYIMRNKQKGHLFDFFLKEGNDYLFLGFYNILIKKSILYNPLKTSYIFCSTYEEPDLHGNNITSANTPKNGEINIEKILDNEPFTEEKIFKLSGKFKPLQVTCVDPKNEEILNEMYIYMPEFSSEGMRIKAARTGKMIKVSSVFFITEQTNKEKTFSIIIKDNLMKSHNYKISDIRFTYL